MLLPPESGWVKVRHAGGMEGYVQRVLRDHWSEPDVARELRHSDEYRNRHR